MTLLSSVSQAERLERFRARTGFMQVSSLRIRLVSWRPHKPILAFGDGSIFDFIIQDFRWTPLTLSAIQTRYRTLDLHHSGSGRLCFEEPLVFPQEGMDAPQAVAGFNLHFLRHWLIPGDTALALPSLCLYRSAKEVWPDLMFHTPMSLVLHAALKNLYRGLEPEDLVGLSASAQDRMLLDALLQILNPVDLLGLSSSTDVEPAPVINGLAVDPHWFATDCAPGYNLRASLDQLGLPDDPDHPSRKG
ncbi:hypothetical protein A0U94_05920 [Gluconobacter albidus]|uniref:hypothetical protein n=1 Tax=Gluconobacter albidus TaxID=318683 RepID=UPI00098B19D1|nr:hypothetical protein [Gluconobacter albidus]AQS90574.1 hypothetical protein A0U94_05920 [Gluconobacter albidus]